MAIDKSLYAMLNALNDTAQTRDDFIRAPFGFPGAKSRSLKNLLSILPYRNVFVDVLAGSGAVLLARHESNLEVFNDRHAGITAFFRCIKDRKKCEELIDILSKTVCSREEFIWARESWPCDWLDDVQRAARWYYCVQHSFNSKGWQFGRTTSGKAQATKLLNNLHTFWPIHNRLRNVYIENCDWRIMLQDFNNENNGNDIVWYIDPPYWNTPTNIYDHSFQPHDHIELAERCMYLNGFIALSGYDCDNHPYNKFSWHKKESWEVRVSMAGLAFTETNHLAEYEGMIKRGVATETVWIRNHG